MLDTPARPMPPGLSSLSICSHAPVPSPDGGFTGDTGPEALAFRGVKLLPFPDFRAEFGGLGVRAAGFWGPSDPHTNVASSSTAEQDVAHQNEVEYTQKAPDHQLENTTLKACACLLLTSPLLSSSIASNSVRNSFSEIACGPIFPPFRIADTNSVKSLSATSEL